MKILVCSDIHGSASGADVVWGVFCAEKPNRVVLCGDIYSGWFSNRAYVNEKLSQIDVPLDVVLGNNDRADDDVGAPFVFTDSAVMHYFGRNLFFTHGHVYNIMRVPPILGEGDVLVYGHTHTGGLAQRNGMYFANVGSVSLPRGGVKNYLVIDDNGLFLKDLHGDIIDGKNWR